MVKQNQPSKLFFVFHSNFSFDVCEFIMLYVFLSGARVFSDLFLSVSIISIKLVDKFCQSGFLFQNLF